MYALSMTATTNEAETGDTDPALIGQYAMRLTRLYGVNDVSGPHARKTQANLQVQPLRTRLNSRCYQSTD